MAFIEKISITCFLASYAVALGLEISRLFFRSGVRGALMVGFGIAGLLAHTLYLGHRAVASATPLASEFDFYLVAAWVLAAVYLYLTIYHPHQPIGLFVLPLVLLFVIGAKLLADPTPFTKTTATKWWGMAHGVFLLLGTVAVTVGFVFGLMYLLQARRLKRKLPPRGLRLPSLEWLERMNTRSIAIAVLTLGCGFLAGIVLGLVQRQANRDVLPWTDPVVLSSSVLVGWMVAAWLFNHLYKPAQQGRKVAYLTVASFVFLLIVLVSMLAPSKHGSGEMKSQISNTKSQTSTKLQVVNVQNFHGNVAPIAQPSFEPWDFRFVSDLRFRALDLPRGKRCLLHQEARG